MSDQRRWRSASVGALRSLPPSNLTTYLYWEVLPGWSELLPEQRAEYADWVWGTLDRHLHLGEPSGPGSPHAPAWDPSSCRVVLRTVGQAAPDEAHFTLARTLLQSGLVHPRHAPFLSFDVGKDGMFQSWRLMGVEGPVMVWSKRMALPDLLDNDSTAAQNWREHWYNQGLTWSSFDQEGAHDAFYCQDPSPSDLLRLGEGPDGGEYANWLMGLLTRRPLVGNQTVGHLPWGDPLHSDWRFHMGGAPTGWRLVFYRYSSMAREALPPRRFVHPR
jgi:hypothetical protein